MARVQTRRTVSFNRVVYEAASIEASRLGVSLAKFVEKSVVARIPGWAEREARISELERQLQELRAVPGAEHRRPGRPRGSNPNRPFTPLLARMVEMDAQGHSPSDIAAAVGSTANSVSSTLSKARKEGRIP